jgi:hypothetical protein
MRLKKVIPEKLIFLAAPLAKKKPVFGATSFKCILPPR